MSKLEIKITGQRISNHAGVIKIGTVTAGGKTGKIEIHPDSSHTFEPRYIEDYALRAAGSKAMLRNAIRDAYEAGAPAES